LRSARASDVHGRECSGAWPSVARAHRALEESAYPKLLFTANPGALVSPNVAQKFVDKLKDCRVVELGAGIHYLQKVHPEVIGTTVNEWLVELAAGSSQKQRLTL
jgi:haloalkane dehalogenase